MEAVSFALDSPIVMLFHFVFAEFSTLGIVVFYAIPLERGKEVE